MRKDYEKLFTYSASSEPSPNLVGKVIQRIRSEQRLAASKWRVALFAVSLLASAVAFIPAFRMMQSGFTESGFMQFFSLLFTDFSIVMTYWKSFGLTLLETLPVVSLSVFFTIVLVFLESFVQLVKNTKALTLSLHH